MADGVVYLDIDDEITSAAARIRRVEGRRVAVVLPYGSRVATSRINFRLLARDALTHEKQLSIVAGDAATRALAASAGLPVFATVGEYEASLGAASSPSGTPGDRLGATTALAAGIATGSSSALAQDAGAPATPSESDEPDDSDESDEPDDSHKSEASAAEAGSAKVADSETTSLARERTVQGVTPGAAGASASPAPRPPVVAGRDGGPGPRVEPVSRPARRRLGRTSIIVGLAVLALAILVGGVAGYLLLPSATAVVTPREESIGPVALSISASTDIEEPDVEAGLVPADVVDVDVEAQGTFPATGKRVEEEAAKGIVRFDNLDPTTSNTIAKGAVVSTASGVRFRTDAKVTVPRAELVGLQIFPASATVKVTAVDAGPEGNVEPNTILTVPRGEEPLFLKVTNPDATSGGARTEFLRVTQEDVDGALAALTAQLDAAFDDRLDDDDLVTGEATVFPETAALGPSEPSVALDTLVGQEVESFDLGASATGTVTTVDAGPVRAIAEARLAASVEPGHVLVEGSSEVSESPAVVEGDTITYPVVATARQIAILDPLDLEARILGRPLDEAREILGAYGEVDLDVWPDWVATVPTLDTRVDVVVQGPTVPDAAPSSPASSDGP